MPAGDDGPGGDNGNGNGPGEGAIPNGFADVNEVADDNRPTDANELLDDNEPSDNGLVDDNDPAANGSIRDNEPATNEPVIDGPIGDNYDGDWFRVDIGYVESFKGPKQENDNDDCNSDNSAQDICFGDSDEEYVDDDLFDVYVFMVQEEVVCEDEIVASGSRSKSESSNKGKRKRGRLKKSTRAAVFPEYEAYKTEENNSDE